MFFGGATANVLLFILFLIWEQVILGDVDLLLLQRWVLIYFSYIYLSIFILKIYFSFTAPQIRLISSFRKRLTISFYQVSSLRNSLKTFTCISQNFITYCCRFLTIIFISFWLLVTISTSSAYANSWYGFLSILFRLILYYLVTSYL